MSFDAVFRMIFAGAFLLPGLAWFGLSFSKKWMASRGRAFARRNLAWVSAPLVSQFDALTSRRARLLGAVLGALGVAFAVAPLPKSDRGQTMAMLAFVIAALYVVAAIELWTFVRIPSPDRLEVRVARVRAVSADDYIWPWARWSMWLIALGAIAIMGGAVAIARLPGVPNWVLGPGVLAGFVAAGVPYSDRLVSRIVRAREPAVDAAHLYWQDALRAESVKRISVLWVLTFQNIAFQALLAFDRGLMDAKGNAAHELIGHVVFPLVFVVAFIPALLASLHSAPGKQWFRKRLWPTLAPSQVLEPGQPIPEQVTA